MKLFEFKKIELIEIKENKNKKKRKFTNYSIIIRT